MTSTAVARTWQEVDRGPQNNICRACRNETKDDPETYGALLDAALERLFEEVPKLRVNLLPMFNISQVRAITSCV